MSDETVGSRYVEKRAPNAPQEVKDKAKARLDKYLNDNHWDTQVRFRVPHSAYQRSGAAQLLAPWVQPRLARIVNDDD